MLLIAFNNFNATLTFIICYKILHNYNNSAILAYIVIM